MLWSLRETVCHIAGSEEGWFRYCAMHELKEWPEYPAASYPTVASLKALLAEVHDRTVQFFSRNDWYDADGMMNRRITLPWDKTTTLKFFLTLRPFAFLCGYGFSSCAFCASLASLITRFNAWAVSTISSRSGLTYRVNARARISSRSSAIVSKGSGKSLYTQPT